MDTKTAIHIGTEVVVIGGLAFYFNKQISGLKAQNVALAKRVEQLTDVIKHHDQILQALIDGRQGGGGGSGGRNPTARRRSHPQQPPKGFTDEELDLELNEEYQKLQDDDVEEIEDVCDGDVCYLKSDATTKKRVRFQDVE